MKEWLKERPCLSISCLEREAGIPTKTLDHYVSGRRGMKEQHMKKVEKVLKKYGFDQKK